MESGQQRLNFGKFGFELSTELVPISLNNQSLTTDVNPKSSQQNRCPEQLLQSSNSNRKTTQTDCIQNTSDFSPPKNLFYLVKKSTNDKVDYKQMNLQPSEAIPDHTCMDNKLVHPAFAKACCLACGLEDLPWDKNESRLPLDVFSDSCYSDYNKGLSDRFQISKSKWKSDSEEEMASSAEQTAQLKQSTLPFIKMHEPVELPADFNAFERSIVKPKKRQNTEKKRGRPSKKSKIQ